jgi:hypothetical protein
MRKLIVIILLFPLLVSAQVTDSSKMYSEITLASRNVWRGVDFGNHLPSAQALITYDIYKNVEVGSFLSMTFTNMGYGNTVNMFVGYKVKVKRFDLSLHVDDYYFNGDKSNIETDFTDLKNAHLVEARFKLKSKRVELVAGHSLYTGSFYATSNNTNGTYIEVTGNAINSDTEKLSLVCGGITAPSGLNFHDKAGIINVSARYEKLMKGAWFWTQLTYNPNYNYISPFGYVREGYGVSKLNMTIGLTLK